MALAAYPDEISAGAAVFDRYHGLADPTTGEKLSRTERLDLCGRAGADAVVGEVVRAAFSDDHSV
jgi:hypothetical protein